MKQNNDCTIEIATARSRFSKTWKNRKWQWSELVERCRNTKTTDETAAEYARMSKEEQSNIKDVGGFVGGYLSGGIRKTANVLCRTVATLDIDFGTPNVWDEFTMNFGFAAMLYSTHKHTPEKPRFRLVFPFSREVKPYEYEPICRKIADVINIDMFDSTTYELARLFYWPSTSKDAEFVFRVQDGKPCDPDEILAAYRDFRDVSSWPISKQEGTVIAREMKKAGDPTEKPGLIGAFCRTYTIEEAIEKFLPDCYEKTTQEGRYTYKQGSVAGGLVCYEGKWAYSHHETDPASRKLCNAFDLCRIHLYGAQDENSRVTEITKLPSYLAMQDFAAADKEVRVVLTQEKNKSLKEDFAGVNFDSEETEAAPASTDWMKELEYTRKGAIEANSGNIITILENDPGLKGHLWLNALTGFAIVEGGLPWDKTTKTWGNMDESNLRVYLDLNYKIVGKDKIKDALAKVLTGRKKHPIREYLSKLKWDGKKRLETLIIDYLGAEDNPLNREMTRKHFTAAVARVMKPGCKYDYCLIVTGKEGIGKSTLFSIMGGEWFSDSLMSMEGKEGPEVIRTAWIIELSELSSMRRSEVEQVKSFLSRQEDIYRPAYGTVVERHPRQCVFCGTTNETYFLKGDTGNRRFWVIKADGGKHTDLRSDLEADRDQLWAEAVEYYKRGEKLYLDPGMEAEARARQQEYNDDNDDPMREMLRTFLNTKLPVDWAAYDLRRRRAYFNDPDPLQADGTETRDRVCAAEFICERLGRDMSDKEYKYLARKVKNLMRDLEEWEEAGTSKHAAVLYGVQRCFRRIIEHSDEEL